LMLILNYFGTLSVSDNDMFYSEAYKQNKILEDLIKGHIAKEEKNKILETEKLVSKYFVSLYSDIKDMKYIIAEKDDSISYELMCYKTIDSKIIEIPFELESKGTKKLLNLLPLMIDAAMGKTVIIDEIDEGIHDLLVNNLVQNIIESINGQIIFTTHDTYLMEQLPKKSMYIIKSDALGNKTIDSLDKYKIDSNNNPAKMYLNGAFGGTPYPRDLDFEDMAEELNYEE
ncbi:TPA: ATP/GTP-binding protein, partial [Enterococcus faecium]